MQIYPFQFVKWFLLLSFILKLQATGSIHHPFYVSVSEFVYNMDSKRMEISVKIFTDDFEKTLRIRHQKPIDLLHPVNPDSTDFMVSHYISENLIIRCDGTTLSPNFLGYEREGEAIWSYFESDEITKPKSIEITNQLLYKNFEGQINILHVRIGKERKSYKLTNPESTASFHF